MAAEERQAALWRRSRGCPKEGDDARIAGEDPHAPPKEEGRGTWMTELPPEKRPRDPNAQMSQASVTQFSKSERKGRGDTSAWTDTPEQAMARKAQMYLEGYSVRRCTKINIIIKIIIKIKIKSQSKSLSKS
eukprot:1182875-Prorocentrum_minimum.AAC.1